MVAEPLAWLSGTHSQPAPKPRFTAVYEAAWLRIHPPSLSLAPGNTAFVDDTLRQRIAAERAIDLGGMGTVTVTAAAGSDGFKGLRTTANGALVMTTVTFSTVYRNTVARSTITVGGTVAKMLGDNASVVGTVTVTYDAMVAFSIPSASEGGQSTVIGLDLVPAKAERDDSQAPTG